jgi:predicted anti-sigma-YlaC factor YlaD
MKLRIDCQEASRWLSRLLDEDVPAAEHARLRLHLVMCQNCRSVEEQMAFLRRAMQALNREQGQGPGS